MKENKNEQDILKDKWEAKHFFSRNHRFENALASEELQSIQFGNDFNIISTKLLEWKSKLSKDSLKCSLLNNMSSALIRMFFYTKNLETTAKSAIAEMLEYKEMYYKKMKTETALNEKIKELEEEIKFTRENS